MRIISQDGMIDMSYEHFSFAISMDNCIVCSKFPKASPSEISAIAEYSSKEKALKAMEMLREAYRECIATVTTTQGLAQALMFADNSEDNLKLSVNIAKEIKEIACFQFPQDSEVEV